MQMHDIKIMVVSEDQVLSEQFRELLDGIEMVEKIDIESDYQIVISDMAHNNYDILLIDENVFEGNGLLLIKRAREQGCTSALIQICDKQKDCDRLGVLRGGATAYVCRDRISNDLMPYILRFASDLNRFNNETNITNRYMRALAQSQQMAMLLIGEDYTVKLANNYAVNMSGALCKFECGKKIGEIIHCYHSEKGSGTCSDSEHREFCPLIKCVEEAFKNGNGIIHREMELVFTKDKYQNKIWARVSVKPVMLEGKRHVVLTIDDMTDRHEIEEMLKNAKAKAKADHENMLEMNVHLEEVVSHTNLMAQEAFEASKAKSDFLANVSHELRTPLNGILGFSQLLLDEDMAQEQKDHVETIYGCAKDLIKVLNNVLEFSRLEKNIITISKSWFGIDDIIDYVIVLYKDAAQEKGLGFHINRAADCPHEIKSDLPKLKQAIFNILDNALKYTSEGQIELVISGRKLNDCKYISFEVIDTGIGISEAVQKNIFESFNQADNSRTREYDGLGLGLSVAKKYVELLGGVIELESTVGEGSRFTISVPVDRRIHHIIDEAPSKELASRGILVAESESHQLNIIKGYLDQMQVDYDATDNGSLALENILYNKYDFALIDVTFPEIMDEAVMELLKERAKDIPIIGICTGKDDHTEELCKTIGCKDRLYKPVLKTKLDAITLEYSSVSSETIEAALDSDAEDFFGEVVPKSYKPIDDSEKFEVESEVSLLADDPEMAELVDCFLDMVPEYLQLMKEAIDIGNYVDVARIAFDFRDSAGGAGFVKLRELIHSLEKAAVLNDIEKVNLLMPDVVSAARNLQKISS